MAQDYTPLFADAGQQTGVDPAWLQAMTQQESNNDPSAVSPKGATGLMQLMPDTAKSLGVTDATDPKQNIPAGAKYYAQHKQKYQDPNLALMAYNWGPGNVNKWIANGSNPDDVPDETKDYVKTVNKNYQKLKAAPEKQMAQTQTQAQDSDPVEDALIARANEKNLPGASTASTPSADVDPVEEALLARSQESNKPKPPNVAGQAKELPDFSPDGVTATAKDVGESAPTGFVSGVNNLLKVPGGLYTFARQLGAQAHNKISGVSPEEAQRNIRTAGQDSVGNFLNSAPTISQLAQTDAASVGNLFRDNNLTTQDLLDTAKSEPDKNPLLGVLHQPETGAGQVTADLTSAVPAGAVMGFKALPAMGGQAGMMAANALSPDNPTGQLIGGMIGGAIPAAAKSITWRPTPEQVASDVIQKESKGVSPADIDTSSIIPGSRPTLSEATGNPYVASTERQYPEMTNANDAAREAVRKQYFQNAAGTPDDIVSLRQTREDAVDNLYNQARVQTVDPKAIQPALDKFNDAINELGDHTDAGKALVSIRDKFQKSLYPKEAKPISTTSPAAPAGTSDKAPAGTSDKAPAGHPKDSTPSNTTTPAALDGTSDEAPAGRTQASTGRTQASIVQAFREERDKADSESRGDDAYAKAVQNEVRPLIQGVGKAIEDQSPPFKDAQDIYRQQSPAINAAEYLQNLKLTSPQGNFTLAKVKTALDKTKQLRNDNGWNPAKDLTNDHMEMLQNLHDDLLQREKTASSGMPRGSPTQHNANVTAALNKGLAGRTNALLGGNAARSLGAAGGAAGSSLFGIPPWLGAMVGENVGGKFANRGAVRAEAAKGAMQNFLMNPEAYKQYLIDSSGNNFLSRFKGNLLQEP